MPRFYESEGLDEADRIVGRYARRLKDLAWSITEKEGRDTVTVNDIQEAAVRMRKA